MAQTHPRPHRPSPPLSFPPLERNARREGWGHIRKRFSAARDATGEATFVLYFVVAVVGVGWLGVWIPLVRTLFDLEHADWLAISREISTCLLGVSCASAVDLLIPDGVAKSVKMFGLTLGVACVVLALLGRGMLPSATVAVISSIAGGATSLLVWFLANSDNEKLMDAPLPDSVTGGPTDVVAGDTTGYKLV